MNKKEIKLVKELVEEKNSIEAEIASIEKGIKNENYRLLYEEACNLLDRVGDTVPPGFNCSEYRMYSQIEGVKNLRFRGDNLIVKIVAPSGRLLPRKIEIRNRLYDIYFIESDKYKDLVDY